MHTVCPPYNQYHETLLWNFTEPLGTCIYNTFDQIAFIIGWLSVASWTFALLPQIITNCKNKAAESQSFWFWLLWLVGDVCNFAGCILTRNLITNIALALVYLSFTAFACLQFMWYEYLLPKYSFLQQQKAYQGSHPLITHSSSSTTSYNSPLSRRTYPPAKEGWWGTPQFAKRYHSRSGPISPTLRKALKIFARSPRMFAVSSQLTLAVRREYEAVQARRRVKQSHLFSMEDVDDSLSSTSYDPSSYSDDRMHKSVKIYGPCITPNPDRSTPQTHTTSSMTQSGQSRHSVLSTNPTDSVPLIANNMANSNPNYGAMSTIMSTLSSMTTTVVMLYGLNGIQSNEEYRYRRRELLSVGNEESVLLVFGMILGWLSSLIYISSRIPQLRLMLNTKVVSGINPLFFVLTFSGNLTQCLSMLINRQIYSNQNDLFSKLPWLASSGVCIFQDGLIIFLLWLYHRDPHHAMGRNHMHRSKGVMIPSPRYLVVNAAEHNKKKNRKKKKKQMNRTDYDRAYFEYKYGDGFSINSVRRDHHNARGDGFSILHTV